MSIQPFEDRVVQYPGRVKLTPVSGQDNVYDVTRAEGVEYKKGTVVGASSLNPLIKKAKVCKSISILTM